MAASTFNENVSDNTPSGKINNFYLFRLSLIAAMGGYLFGFDFAVISGALPFLRDQFGLNEYWEGFTTGCLALGCISGCFIAARTSEKYGRRPALLLSAFIFAWSSAGMALAPGLSSFIFFRFCAGLGVGMASMLAPMFIAEVSPPQVRGRMVSIYQLTIVLGILFTSLVNYSLRNHGVDAWRWMFGSGVLPSVIFFIGVCFLPESPQWLFKNNKDDKARKILSAIGDQNYVDACTVSIKQSLTGVVKMNYAAALKKPFVTAVLLGIGLAVFQQFCGINVVFNYTSNIFASIGASQDDQLLQTVFIGGVNLVFTLLAILLVDKLGRKPLMLLGAGGLCVLYIIIAIVLGARSATAAAIFLLAAIGLYATTLAPITWVLISEIFPNKVRDAASSIAIMSLWAAYFVLTFTFPILTKLVGGVQNTFYVYAAICLAGFILIYFKVHETKGKSLEEIEADLMNEIVKK
ncbi:sugar porter family MFS transporter [Chitinophaga sp. MM2321]|uniref:sugar porter family MFS transporter n=1 Tax=Chitinophaga sp. MM2321 TaxID=3137178 RepID=UPI0032D56CA9